MGTYITVEANHRSGRFNEHAAIMYTRKIAYNTAAMQCFTSYEDRVPALIDNRPNVFDDIQLLAVPDGSKVTVRGNGVMYYDQFKLSNGADCWDNTRQFEQHTEANQSQRCAQLLMSEPQLYSHTVTGLQRITHCTPTTATCFQCNDYG